MVNKRKSLFAITGFLLGISIVASSHPLAPGNEHPHNNQTVKWEADPVKDGTSGHNHVSAIGQSAHASHCWDNDESRWTSWATGNSAAHCYIDEEPSLGKTPTFSFGPGWTGDAKDRIEDAIAQYTALWSVSHDVGIELFPPFLGETADISIVWDDQLTDTAVYSPGATPKLLRFPYGSDWSFWDFSKSKSGVSGDDWHFYSYALHEIGHVFGLEHSLVSGSVMNVYGNPAKIGRPKNLGGVHVDELSSTDAFAAVQLYAQPPGQPPPPNCTVVPILTGCQGPVANFTVTASLPGYSVSNADYDVQFPGGSTWIDIFEGSLTCPAANLSIGALARVILSTIYGDSICYVTIPYHNCQEQENW